MEQMKSLEASNPDATLRFIETEISEFLLDPHPLPDSMRLDSNGSMYDAASNTEHLKVK